MTLGDISRKVSVKSIRKEGQTEGNNSRMLFIVRGLGEIRTLEQMRDKLAWIGPI